MGSRNIQDVKKNCNNIAYNLITGFPKHIVNISIKYHTTIIFEHTEIQKQFQQPLEFLHALIMLESLLEHYTAHYSRNATTINTEQTLATTKSYISYILNNDI